ncbi:MAG: NYN domain-containing protein [Lachnospiraceae bacterium]|nr:NYN domain-containing protein [Lachnospiraceae bacterium]
MEDKNLALLIDSDNIAPTYIENILGELAKYGKVTIRRMYGDWSQDRLKSWLEYSAKYSLTPVMQANDTPRKNASDIGLVIDAMDILYTGNVDGFCIASSDADFNKLAKRLRESGSMVIGMGERKTPESFRASCEKFIFLDVLDDDIDNGELDLTTASQKEEAIMDKSVIEKTIIDMILDSGSEEIRLGEIGRLLGNIFSDFDVRNYHYSKLSEFISEFDSLLLKKINNAYWVSLHNSPVKDIEKKILAIFKASQARELNIGELKQRLSEQMPDLDSAIKQSGITKFKVFLERKIDVIEVEENTAKLKQ